MYASKLISGRGGRGRLHQRLHAYTYAQGEDFASYGLDTIAISGPFECSESPSFFVLNTATKRKDLGNWCTSVRDAQHGISLRS